MNIFTAVKYCCLLHGRVCVMYNFGARSSHDKAYISDQVNCSAFVFFLLFVNKFKSVYFSFCFLLIVVQFEGHPVIEEVSI